MYAGYESTIASVDRLSVCGNVQHSAKPRPNSSLRPPLTTAQGLLDYVVGDKGRSRNQRKNEAAAIRWLGKVDGTRLSVIPLDARYLVDNRIRLIRQHTPITKARRSNIVTLLNQVLRRVGVLTVGARRGGLTSHEWTVLINSLPTLSARASLSSLAKFCSARAVTPNEVTLEVWQTYCDETLHRSSFKNPRTTLRRTVKTSNAARATISGWPLPELPRLINPRAVSLPRSVLPISFWQDLDRYTEMSSAPSDNVFDMTWPKQLATATLKRYREVAWRTASAQVHQGREAAEITGLAALLDVAWLRSAMSWFYRRADNSFRQDHLNMAATWVSFADNYVHSPPEITEQVRHGILKVIQRKLAPQGFSRKNIQRLGQFSNSAAIERLLLTPYQIMDEVRNTQTITVADATKMMAAVGIELLLTTMIRRKNLADLDLKRCFWPAEPTEAGWWLTVDASDVKNRQPLRFALSKPTIGLIEYYLRRCRPLLLQRPSDLLFLRTNGEPKGQVMMAHLVTRTIRRRLGLEVNVHLFRHIGTMLYLNVYPGQFGVPRAMLGHRSDRTTQRFYAPLQTTQAIEHFTGTVLGRRNETVTGLGAPTSGFGRGSPSVTFRNP